MLTTVVLCAMVALSQAETFFSENFNDGDAYTSRWVSSTHKGDEAGEWKLSAGKFFGDAEKDIGLQTAEDARFYQISAAAPAEFSNVGKKLIVQYSVKHEQGIDCGGGYLKLMPAGLDQSDFNGDSDYNIMFGPDICGATKRVHVIFNYKGQNHLLNKEIPCPSDELSHLYTLIVNPDATYEVKIDGESKQSGSLKDDWDMLAPREIDDPEASKPADWVDEAMIDDPEDVKPADWDDVEAQIHDPDATMPDDWDEELDGDWEAPLIPNPEYKGEWAPKRIANPDYKGEWEHPQIANPDFVDDDTLGQYASHQYVGIEIWQVKSGTIFDRFLITDSEADADAAAKDFVASAEGEKAAAAEAAAAAEEDAEEDEEDEEADEANLQDEL